MKVKNPKIKASWPEKLNDSGYQMAEAQTVALPAQPNFSDDLETAVIKMKEHIRRSIKQKLKYYVEYMQKKFWLCSLTH